MTEYTYSRPSAPISSQPVRRGDMFYVLNTVPSDNGDPKPGRPAIVVSNDHTNNGDDYIMTVFLTTHPSQPRPTHITLNDTLHSVALCERVYTTPKSRLGQFIRHLSDEEMRRIDLALVHSLGIPSTVPAPVTVDTRPEVESLRQEVAFLSRMNNVLLDRLSGGKEAPRAAEAYGNPAGH